MSEPFPTFRDLLRKISPPWLSRGHAEKLGYAMSVQLDAFGEVLDAGMRSRFPNVYSSESLPAIGRERRIRRGRVEGSASYAGRLRRWLVDHKRRGGHRALLEQIHAFYAPNNFPVDLVYRNGRRYQMDVNGTITRDDITWGPDTVPEQWARWWLFYWSDDFNTGDAETLRLIPTEWNAAHTLGTLMVMPTGAELIDYPPGHTIDEPGTINTPGPSVIVSIA